MNLLPASTHSPNPQAFEWLAAEQEGLWFDQVFVEPPRYSEMAGLRNTVIFGESGSGKTAVAAALASFCARNSHDRCWLPVRWHPSIPKQLSSTLTMVDQLLDDLFSACAEALTRYIFFNPDYFKGAKPWVQQSLISFIRQTHPDDLEIMLFSIEDETGMENDSLRRMLMDANAKEAFPANVTASKKINYLKSMVIGLPGLKGIWVIGDGMETWVELSPDLVKPVFKAFFSMLNLFEDPEFVFKLCLPNELEPATVSANGLLRRRLENFSLKWEDDRLLRIVDRRIANRLGKPNGLPFIYKPDALCDYLKKYGGNLPRGWLDMIRPFLEESLAKDPPAPLTEAEFQQVQRQHPPRLRVDSENKAVMIGYGEIQPGLQSRLFRILSYLYEKRRVCSREEIYFLAYQSFPNIPEPGDKNYQFPKEYNGALDTALWRLRQQIESDPKNPVYLLTMHSQGIRLDNIW